MWIVVEQPPGEPVRAWPALACLCNQKGWMLPHIRHQIPVAAAKILCLHFQVDSRPQIPLPTSLSTYPAMSLPAR